MGLERINEIRKEKGLRSKELSRLSGVPIGTLNKILNGQSKNPTLETVIAIAKALGCSTDEFSNSGALQEKEKPRPQWSELSEREQRLIFSFRDLSDDAQDHMEWLISHCNDIRLQERLSQRVYGSQEQQSSQDASEDAS